MKKLQNNNYGPNPRDYREYNANGFTVKEYLGSSLWRCVCECGVKFKCRGHLISKRIGCRGCTASIVSVRRHDTIDHYGYLNRVYKGYKRSALKKKVAFKLTFDQFHVLVLGDCHYCGEPPTKVPPSQYILKRAEPLKRNGIDRVDAIKGYILKNCVSCCTTCNYAKNSLTLDQFLNWVYKIYNYQNKESSTTIPKGSTSQANGDGNGNRPTKDDDIV